MKQVLICCTLLLLVSLVTTGPVLNSEEEGSDIIRLPRQSIQPCNDRSDCYPDGVTFVPTNLINCIDNRCFCDQCFTRNTTGQCGMTIPSPATCYYYDEQSDQCVDNRKSQLVAFILSLTLSGVGVANFYIGQNGLAAGQLVLFFSIFLIICFAVCIPCCAVCCLAQTEDVKGSLFFICFMLLMILLVFAIFFGIWGWWIADAVIFGTNQRDAGDGCPLNPDL